MTPKFSAERSASDIICPGTGTCIGQGRTPPSRTIPATPSRALLPGRVSSGFRVARRVARIACAVVRGLLMFRSADQQSQAREHAAMAAWLSGERVHGHHALDLGQLCCEQADVFRPRSVTIWSATANPTRAPGRVVLEKEPEVDHAAAGDRATLSVGQGAAPGSASRYGCLPRSGCPWRAAQVQENSTRRGSPPASWSRPDWSGPAPHRGARDGGRVPARALIARPRDRRSGIRPARSSTATTAMSEQAGRAGDHRGDQEHVLRAGVAPAGQ